MRFAQLKKVTQPGSIAEAVRILSDEKRKAIPLGGGVSFIFSPPAGAEELVLLSYLPLSYIKKQTGGLRIGAATPIADIIDSAPARDYADGVLYQAARGIGSTLNRNLITIGGSLVQPFIWSDLPALVVALGVRLKIQGKKSRVISAEKFFSRVPRQVLKRGEFLSEIIFPAPAPHSRAAWREFTLTENDFALLKLAVVLTRTRRLCREIVIVAGGGVLLPQRLREAEEALRGRKADQELVNQVSEIAAEELKLNKDMRCSEEYKRNLGRALLRGILEEILLDQKVPEWKLL